MKIYLSLIICFLTIGTINAQGIRLSINAQNVSTIPGSIVLASDGPLLQRGMRASWSFITSLPLIPIRFRTVDGLFDCYSHRKRLYIAPGMTEGDTITINILQLHYSQSHMLCECDGTACLER